MESSASTAIAQIHDAGPVLPADLAKEVLALGESAVPELVAILERAPAGPIGGEPVWSQIHAVDLLVALDAEESLPAMLRLVAQPDVSAEVGRNIVDKAPRFGKAIVEPVLALFHGTPDGAVRWASAQMLARAGVRDQRIFAAIRELFTGEGELMATHLFADYGDAAAAPLIERMLLSRGSRVRTEEEIDALKPLMASYVSIVGELPLDFAERFQAVVKASFGKTVTREAAKVGRNDPCPCGSGKKFKKCCLGAEAS